MKNLFAIVLTLALAPAFAQVSNSVVTDCNNVTKKMHDVLGQGKVLIVASKGLDCSICKSQAPALQNFAFQNKPAIEVWGAMTFKSGTNTPNCSQVGTWVNDYSWTDIFAFVDSNRDWFQTGTPRYYTIDPRDSSIAYAGFSSSAAQTEALNIVNALSLSTAEFGTLDNVSAFFTSNALRIEYLPNQNVEYRLIDLTGKLIVAGNNAAQTQIEENIGLLNGIYLLQLTNENGEITSQKIIRSF